MAASHLKRGGRWYIKASDPNTGMRFRGPITKLAGLWASEMRKRKRENVAPRTEADVKTLQAFVVACLARGEDPARVGVTQYDPATHTMDDVFTRYVEHRREDAIAHGYVFNESQSFHVAQRACRKAFGQLLPSEMVRARVVDFITQHVKADNDASTPHEYCRRFAAQACAWAAANGIMRNPFGKWAFKLDARSESRGNVRCEPETEARLLELCATWELPWFADFIVMAIDLACREGELLALRNRDVDWHRHVLVFQQTKRFRRGTKRRPEARTVLFNPQGRVATILQRAKFRGPDAFVIDVPAIRSTTRVHAARIAKAYCVWFNLCLQALAGIERTPGMRLEPAGTPVGDTFASLRMWMHGLRHEAITRWSLAELSKDSRKFLDGHDTQFDMDGRYDHAKEINARRELAEKVWPRETARGKPGPKLSQSHPPKTLSRCKRST